MRKKIKQQRRRVGRCKLKDPLYAPYMLTMLYVRLVKVQLISGVTPGRIENATLRTMAIKTFVNQVPRRLSQVLFGFSSLLVHIFLGGLFTFGAGV